MNRKVPSGTRRYSRVVLTLLLLIVQFRVSAQLTPQPTDDFWKPYRLLEEDRSRRDAFSKHYRLTDGNYTAVIGAGPIHYLKNGEFLDIEFAISDNDDPNYPYANVANLMESFFGATAHVGIKNRTAEGELVEFRETKMYWETPEGSSGWIRSADVPVEIRGDKAYYRNLFGAVDAEFRILAGKRKLNYIIPDREALAAAPANAEYLVFSEDILLPEGWGYEMDEKWGLLINDVSGATIYCYELPRSTDANGNPDRENTLMETVRTENGLTIRVKVKTAWLLAPERTFPVNVDPTVNATPNNTTGWTGAAWADGLMENDVLTAGYYSSIWTAGFSRFNLSSIPVGSTITAATGYINITAGSGTNITTRQFAFSNSADPLTLPPNLYNTMTTAYSASTNITALGWRSSLFNAAGRTLIQNGIASGFIALGVFPMGTWYNNSYMQAAGYSSANRPYLALTYMLPLSTLTVTGAGTGANPADGSYTYSPGTSVTATAGTRSGFVLTGWTGTGSVPASGTGSSVTFTINQNSTVTWNWTSVTATAAPIFHNYGGSAQLAFNNSRFNIGASPVFRLSHTLNAATDYRIEIHTAADYSGASWSHRFSGTYTSGTEANFTFPASAGFVPLAGTTYYVRAATSGDNGNVWSAWSQGTYSFTQEGAALPDWYQTTAPQFLTDTLIATQATASGVGLLAAPGSNPIVNPNFTNTSGWTVWKTSGTEALIEVSSTDCSNCPAGTTRNLKMYLWTASVLSGDMLIVSQQVDLTNVDEIRFNASSYYGPNGSNPGGAVSNLRFIIGGTSSNEAGTVLHTTSQAYCPTYCTNSLNDPNIVINTSSYTGVQMIKFVVKFTQTHTTQGLLSFYVNNVQASSDVPGRVIGTPVNLASVKDAVAYDRVEWTQTLNGGTVNLKLQYQNGNAWTDVPGHDNISATTDGLQTHSLTGMTPYARVRLVGRLSGAAGVLLNNWSIKFPIVDPLPVVMERFTAHCHDGRVKLDWLTSSEQNNDRFLLQRSANLADWEDLATVAGNGNSNRPIAYASVDERPYRHTGYYRLIQTDYDGTSATYGPVSVSCLATEAGNGIRIYPNPAADYFTLALHLQQAVPDAELVFTDPNGKICRTQRLALAEGDSEFLLEREGLAAGMYVVTVRAGNVSLPPVKLLLR